MASPADRSVGGLDRILCDRSSGNLHFDADGSGEDHGRILFAKLAGITSLGHSDFLVV